MRGVREVVKGVCDGGVRAVRVRVGYHYLLVQIWILLFNCKVVTRCILIKLRLPVLLKQPLQNFHSHEDSAIVGSV